MRLWLRRAGPWVVLVLVAGFVVYKLRTSHFDWALVAASWKTADLRFIVLALVVIQLNYVMRAMRWAIFLRPAFRNLLAPPLHWWSLIGSQFVGFTGLAIFGRIGELIRPLLVARRTGLTFSSQIAVVTVERVFDLGAFALIFSLNLLFSPGLQTLPYLHKAGIVIATLTVGIAVFVALVWFAGEWVARAAMGSVGRISQRAGEVCAEKIRAFRGGLNVVGSFGDLSTISLLSLVMWATIALTYWLVLYAFPAPVHALTVGEAIVLLGFSIAGSALPIPGGGGAWAGIVFALTNLLKIPVELAGLAGLMIWLIGSMSVIPLGLIFARIEGVSLRQTAQRSEAAEEAGTE